MILYNSETAFEMQGHFAGHYCNRPP